jgi:hypothetical protein
VNRDALSHQLENQGHRQLGPLDLAPSLGRHRSAMMPALMAWAAAMMRLLAA